MNKKTTLITLLFGLVFITTSLNAQPQSLEERVKRLERITDNPVLMQLSRKLGQQQSEIQQLYDQVDRLQHKLNLMESKQNNRYKETDDRLSELKADRLVLSKSTTAEHLNNEQSVKSIIAEKTKIMAGASKPTIKTEAAKPNVIINKPKQVGLIKTRAANKLEKSKYKAAFSLMKNKKYEAARLAFVEFKDTHPTSSLASNALYWAGEASLVLNKKQLGLDYFLEVITHYAKSYKAPDALLRAADTFKGLHKIEQAKASYLQIQKDYPESQAAKRAAKGLKRIAS